VRTEIEGLIEQIYVTEGAEVRAGQIVARLSDRGLRAQLDETEAQISQTRARLRMLRAGPTREEVELASTAVDDAQDAVRYARARLERSRALTERELLPRTELENTEEAAVMAENDLVEARQKLQLLERGARPEELAAMEAEMERLESHRRFLADQLRRLEVRSPNSGIVVTPARHLRERVGQGVAPGELIAKVYEMKTLTVEIAVPEKEIADVAVGRKVALKARAFPNRTFHGVVTSIATTAQGGATGGESASAARADSRTVLVTTEIDNSSL
jgi:putative peptide zinc metalloprotease protein